MWLWVSKVTQNLTQVKCMLCIGCRESWTRSGWRFRSWKRQSRPNESTARSHAPPNVPFPWCPVRSSLLPLIMKAWSLSLLENFLELLCLTFFLNAKCYDYFPVWSGRECEDIYRRGGKDSQLYMIQPDALTQPYKVFCDQTTQNGGKDDSVHFSHFLFEFKYLEDWGLWYFAQAGFSSRIDWTAVWTLADVGMNTAVVLGTLPLMLERVTAKSPVRHSEI